MKSRMSSLALAPSSALDPPWLDAAEGSRRLNGAGCSKRIDGGGKSQKLDAAEDSARCDAAGGSRLCDALDEAYSMLRLRLAAAAATRS